jgi:bifunctional DNase/RNase
VEIVNLKEDIFYGNIIAEAGGQTAVVDSRPSDAIALALRAHVPILVSQAVMDEAGIVPEQDIQGQASAPSSAEAKPAAPPPGDGEGRLEVFEDFLKKLDRDKKDSESGQADQDKPKKKPKK